MCYSSFPSGDGKWLCRDGVGGRSTSYAKTVSARLFITIAGVLSLFSVLSILSILLVDAETKKRMALLAKVLSIGSLVAGILGLALGINFALTLSDDFSDHLTPVKIHASSILAILGFIFNLLGGIVAFIIK